MKVQVLGTVNNKKGEFQSGEDCSSSNRDGMGMRKMLLLLRLQRGRSVGNKLSGCSVRALLVLEGTCKVGGGACRQS